MSKFSEYSFLLRRVSKESREISRSPPCTSKNSIHLHRYVLAKWMFLAIRALRLDATRGTFLVKWKPNTKAAEYHLTRFEIYLKKSS